MLWYYWYEDFDGNGSEVAIDVIKEHASMRDNNYEIQLFENDKIVKLDIPFSEIYHKCTDSEWIEVLDHISRVLGQDVQIHKRKRLRVKIRERLRGIFGRS